MISLFVGLAPSAFAAETDEYPAFLELLDYGYVQHDDHFVSGNRTEIIDEDETVYFNLPYGMTMNYIDMLIYVSASVSVDVSAGHSAWGYYSLSYKQISANLWRVYGRIPEHTYEKIEIKFSSSSTAGYVNFYSCRVGFNGMNSAAVTLNVTSNFGFSNSSWVGNRNFTWTTEPVGTDLNTSFQVNIKTSDWAGYDYITVILAFEVSSITGINAMLGAQPVPLEITYLESIEPSAELAPRYMFAVTLDVSGFERSARNSLQLYIEGIPLETTYSVFQFLSAYGYANIRYADPVLYWFQELAEIQKGALSEIDSIGLGIEAIAGLLNYMYIDVLSIKDTLQNEIVSYLGSIDLWLGDIRNEVSAGFETIYNTLVVFREDLYTWTYNIRTSIVTWGQNIFHALTPDTSKSEQMADEMASQATEMDELNQGLESMEKPDVDNIDTDISDIVSDGDITMVSGAFSVVLSDGIIGSMFVLSLLFMLASYVLFGKR